MGFLDKFEIRKIDAAASKVDRLSEKYRNMSDEELQGQTAIFKERLSKGESLDHLLPEAFAAAREACLRVRGEYPYHEQIMGGIVLHGGNVAELQTGQGKTLTAVMPVYLNALEGKGVHVITVNEYLAERDRNLMGPIYKYLGLTTGLSLAASSREEKQAAYACDITYTTNSEAGFDYLRDNMVHSEDEKVQRGLHYAIIDECDSILIDEARTPLIISSGEPIGKGEYESADRFVKSLEPEDYDIDLERKAVTLTSVGIEKAEKYYGTGNLYTQEFKDTLHRLFNALKANLTMMKDVDYVIQDDEIVIVDPNTGRTMKGREWSHGLHQAVSAKEHVEIKEETVTQATVTYQNFFRMYTKLSGMTGTAKTSEEEFHDVYNMYVDQIPPHQKNIRKDLPDIVFGTKSVKYKALIDQVETLHKTGQPILVGTVSVETSELLSSMLKERGIPHETLNAKNHAAEAEIIAKAGQKNAVTIATNMAGRGTDIKLGEGAAEAGGLAVLGSERHESKRIDNQLRGRSGRQGDPGVSQFFVSAEDDLMVRFGAEKLKESFKKVGDQPVTNKILRLAFDEAQDKVEASNFDSRKKMLEYDNVANVQRKQLYKERNLVLSMTDPLSFINTLFKTAAKAYASFYVQIRDTEYTRIPVSFKRDIGMFEELPLHAYSPASIREKGSAEEVANSIYENLVRVYNEKTSAVRDLMIPYEKSMILKVMDEEWIDEIAMLDELKNGIGLRGYASKDPLLPFIEESYAMYDRMMVRIAARSAVALSRVNVEVDAADPRLTHEMSQQLLEKQKMSEIRTDSAILTSFTPTPQN